MFAYPTRRHQILQSVTSLAQTTFMGPTYDRLLHGRTPTRRPPPRLRAWPAPDPSLTTRSTSPTLPRVGLSTAKSSRASWASPVSCWSMVCYHVDHVHMVAAMTSALARGLTSHTIGYSLVVRNIRKSGYQTLIDGQLGIVGCSKVRICQLIAKLSKNGECRRDNAYANRKFAASRLMTCIVPLSSQTSRPWATVC